MEQRKLPEEVPTVSPLHYPQVVQAEINANQLGPVSTQYHPPDKLRPTIAGLVFRMSIFLVIAALVFWLAVADWSAHAPLLVAVVFVIIALIFLALAALSIPAYLARKEQSRRRIYLCDKGFVLADEEGAETFLYNEIDLWYKLTRVYRNGSYVGERQSFTIVRERDGRKLHLEKRHFENLLLLGTQIGLAINQQRLPVIETAVQAGQTVWFKSGPNYRKDKIGISVNGLVKRQRGEEQRLPWNELRAGKVDKDGYLTLYTEQKKFSSWFYWDISLLGNYNLFETLINQKLREHGKPPIEHKGYSHIIWTNA